MTKIIMDAGKKMKTNNLDRMIGQHCKIVMKEPGDSKARVVIGTIQEIDHRSHYIMVKSYQGIYCINLSVVVAIKPKKILFT